MRIAGAGLGRVRPPGGDGSGPRSRRCRPLRYAGLASPRLCHALAGAAWLSGLYQLCRANRAPGRAAAVRARSGRPLHLRAARAAPAGLRRGGGQDSTERQMFAARVFILLVPSTPSSWPLGAARAIWAMRTRSSAGSDEHCGSHLTAVCLFYGSAITYLQPTHSPITAGQVHFSFLHGSHTRPQPTHLHPQE